MRSISMFTSPFEQLSSHHGELGHYAPSSSGHTKRPYGNLFLKVLLRTRSKKSGHGVRWNWGSPLGATYRTPEIITSEIIVYLEWHVFQWMLSGMFQRNIIVQLHDSKDCHLSSGGLLELSNGLSVAFSNGWSLLWDLVCSILPWTTARSGLSTRSAADALETHMYSQSAN